MTCRIDLESLSSSMKSQGLTQKELAEISGVSRAQVSRIFSGRSSLRRSTAEKLARALRTDVDAILAGGRLRHYRQCVSRAFGRIDFRGIGIPQFPPAVGSQLFTDPMIRERKFGDDECRPVRSGSNEPEPFESATSKTALECIRAYDRVVLIGGPGSGKSTALRYVASEYASAAEDGDPRPTPIYLRIADIDLTDAADRDVDILSVVSAWAAQSGCPDADLSLDEELRQGRCILLLDGLDEAVSQDARLRVAASLAQFVQRHPRNRFVLTSRTVAFEPEPWLSLGFAIFEMRGFGTRERRVFARRWSEVRRPSGLHDARERDDFFEDLCQAIEGNSRVRAIASNPLMLTILAMLHEARGTLPRRRVDLYERLVEVFLDTWEASKWTQRRGDARTVQLEARELRWLLGFVALTMQRADRTVAPRWWLTDRILEFLQQRLGFTATEAKAECDRVLRYLYERAGIVAERGPDVFAFSHRTLQEYFSATGLLDELDARSGRDFVAHVRDYLYNPAWSEVIRLVAAIVKPAQAEALLSTLIDDPDPAGRFLHRGTILALRCLADGAAASSRALVTSMFRAIGELGTSKWLGITLAALDVLDAFKGSRWEDIADRTRATILDKARLTLDEREFVILHHAVHAAEIQEQLEAQLHMEGEAAVHVAVSVDGQTYQNACLNASLLAENPSRWYESVCEILSDSHHAVGFKRALVGEIGGRIRTEQRAAICVKKILRSSADESLREACAFALERVASDCLVDGRSTLLRVLANEASSRVRRACAGALSYSAECDRQVRDALLRVLEEDSSAEVRGGAARGLERVARHEKHVRERLLRILSSEGQPDRLRRDCAAALADLVGESDVIHSSFRALLDAESEGLRHISAQALAKAIADEVIAWDDDEVSRIEGILMSLEEPCVHALAALGELVNARELRRGLRIETVLRDALSCTAAQIDVAFVFGSTARREQRLDSDIDLMVIGSATLRDLSEPLRRAEDVLGRRVNPAIYTTDSFRRRFQSGDPFLREVMRSSKITVTRRNSGSDTELDDELRAMVAERVAAGA